MPKLKSKKRAPIKSVHVSTPRPMVNDAKYEPTYQYECPKGHVSANDHHPLTKCPSGNCQGPLTRIGKGAGRGRKAVTK